MSPALSSEMQHVPCLLAPSEQSFDLLLIQWRNGEGYKSQYWPRQCSPWRQSWFWWTSPAGNKIKKTGVELDKNCTVRVCRIFLFPSGTGHFKYHFAWWQRRGGGLNAYIRRSQVNRSEGISGMSVVSSQWMCGCVNMCVCAHLSTGLLHRCSSEAAGDSPALNTVLVNVDHMFHWVTQQFEMFLSENCWCTTSL